MKRLQRVLDECARALKIKREQVVSIAFVSNTQMRELNRTWRGKDKVTDVLSFGMDGGVVKGEILLSYEQAARQAKQMKHSIKDEMCFLIVHGVLHLWGYDHEDSKDAQQMFSIQEKILQNLKINPRISTSNVKV